MKLSFEESQRNYDSGSQSARAWTEKWVGTWLYCANCGNSKLEKFPNNRPAADFHCPRCGEEFELKSQRGRFGRRVADGAYRTLKERVSANNNPNFLLMNYDFKEQSVTDLFVVPKHFFTASILEERRPLAPTARRAGWVGCNIMIGEVPESGRIFYVRDRQILDREEVLENWQKTLFLRQASQGNRGWLLETLKCIEQIGHREFTLREAYASAPLLQALFPGNRNVKPKIRQQLQFLRDNGVLKFLGNGRYQLV